MKESYNLVVSFEGEDNRSSDKKRGWIDNFCRYLQIFVTRLSSQEIKVTKSSEIKDKDAGKVIFVPVISPGYLQSENCKKELNHYFQSGCPVFRVQKLPVERKLLNSEINQLLSYNFYEKSVEAENGYFLYDPDSYNKNYWLKLIDLAYDIIQSISASAHQSTQGKIVYLAETTFDQESNRDMLKRELQRYGHTILPARPLPEDPKMLEKEIRECLEQCSVAIHIVGAHYGQTINGTELSLVEFQNKIAGRFVEERFDKDKTILKRYLWSPPYLRPADEKQMLYLDQLKEEMDRTTNAEIIQVPLENLKSIIEKNLDQNRKAKQTTVASVDKPAANSNAVYLIYDQEDAADVTVLKAELEKNKLSVLTPGFEGNQLNLLDVHRQNLVTSDAVFIYANRSNHFWLESKINDLIKAPGFGRTRPFLVKAVCAPNHAFNASAIKGYQDMMSLKVLDDNSIQSFLEKLK